MAVICLLRFKMFDAGSWLKFIHCHRIERFWPLLGFVAISACSGGPSGWSLDLENKLHCGMTVAAVQVLTERRLEPGKWQVPWATHVIRGRYGRPEMYLGFPDGQLATIQLQWEYPFGRVAQYPAEHLCGGRDSREPPT